MPRMSKPDPRLAIVAGAKTSTERSIGKTGIISNYLECLSQVRDNIRRIFDADGEAHEIVFDAQFQPFFGGLLVEGHERGLFDQAIYAAQAGRDVRDFQ